LFSNTSTTQNGAYGTVGQAAQAGTSDWAQLMSLMQNAPQVTETNGVFSAPGIASNQWSSGSTVGYTPESWNGMLAALNPQQLQQFNQLIQQYSGAETAINPFGSLDSVANVNAGYTPPNTTPPPATLLPPVVAGSSVLPGGDASGGATLGAPTNSEGSLPTVLGNQTSVGGNAAGTGTGINLNSLEELLSLFGYNLGGSGSSGTPTAPGQGASTPTITSALNNAFGIVSTQDPNLTNALNDYLESQIGTGLPQYPGSLSAPLETLLSNLNQALQTGNTTGTPYLSQLMQSAQGNNNIQVPSGLQQLASTGDLIDQTPAWQAMVASEQQNIAQNAALLQGQNAASGNIDSSINADALANYYQQTALGQNAALTQAQTTAMQTAVENMLSANTSILGTNTQNVANSLASGTTLTNQANTLGNQLQTLDQNSIDRLVNEFYATLPQTNPLLSNEQSASQTYPPTVNNQTGLSLLGALLPGLLSLNTQGSSTSPFAGLGGLVSSLFGSNSAQNPLGGSGGFGSILSILLGLGGAAGTGIVSNQGSQGNSGNSQQDVYSSQNPIVASNTGPATGTSLADLMNAMQTNSTVLPNQNSSEPVGSVNANIPNVNSGVGGTATELATLMLLQSLGAGGGGANGDGSVILGGESINDLEIQNLINFLWPTQ
jgi:hypothetical protein